MPPKKTPASSDASDKSNDPAHILLTFLSHSSAVTGTDWSGVAAEYGINYTRNALSKIKAIAVKYGFEYHSGKISKPTAVIGEDGTLEDTIDTPKPISKSNKKKVESRTSEDPKTPSKKRKASASLGQVKVEDEGEQANENAS